MSALRAENAALKKQLKQAEAIIGLAIIIGEPAVSRDFERWATLQASGKAFLAEKEAKG